MTLEFALWRADDTNLTRLRPSGIALESQLEDYLEADPTLLGERVLLIGRQVPTAHGGFVDLLAVDEDGNVHVLELKRNKTPRDVVGQPVEWEATVPLQGAIWRTGMFANQNSACKLRKQFTIDSVEQALGLATDSSAKP